MIRRPLVLLLPLALLLAGCTDHLLPTAAPEAPLFVQMPASPVVNSLLDDGSGCTEAKCTLRDAIAFARAGGTIIFSVTGTIVLAQGQLLIDKDLNINGPGATYLSVSGNDAHRVFYIGSGHTVSISGLTITGGNEAGDEGGGISNQRSTLRLANSTISGNHARWGGGIFNRGTLTITHSTVSANSAVLDGGGIDNLDVLTIAHSSISANSAVLNGGGIWTGGEVTIENSTVSGNRASSEGGGINNTGTLTLRNSTVSGNGATLNGGGIWAGGTVILQNSTVAGNSAGLSGGGGGIYNYYSRLTFQNSILARSTTAGVAGGDCRPGADPEPGADTEVDGGYNLVEDGSCISASTSRSGDPMLGPLADNGGPTRTYALLAGSPAIDAIPSGSNGCGISTDQRGFPRPQGGACDIGAFEVQSPAPPPPPPTIGLSIAADGTFARSSGVATLSGAVSCSAPVELTLNVVLIQEQTRGRNTIIVRGSQNVSVPCSGTHAWTATITPTSGKFAAGAASATAEVAGASPPVRTEQAVQLR